MLYLIAISKLSQNQLEATRTNKTARSSESIAKVREVVALGGLKHGRTMNSERFCDMLKMSDAPNYGDAI